jgi:molecular chaperone GrpE
MAKDKKPVEEEVSNEDVETSSQEESKTDPLQECQEELAKQKDNFLRVHADFENYKKRLEKEKATALAYANESFATDLLTVLDTFENALKSIDNLEVKDESVEKIKEGMQLTYDQLLSILKKNGVCEVECDKEFDPNYHQAVTQMESNEHKSGEIVQVLQKGYKLKDRLLRPSMVATCK